jgi:hypothetical protein
VVLLSFLIAFIAPIGSNGKTINGIEFTGANCTDSRIEGNEIGNHKIGLYYSNTAVVGPQPPTGVANTSGNKWNGTYSNNFGSAAAVNINIYTPNTTTLNPNIIDLNQFRANQASGSSIFPDNYPDNSFSTNWFLSEIDPVIESCIINDCGNSGGGGNSGVGTVNNTTGMVLEHAVVEGVINTTGYKDQSKWMLEKNLLQVLMNNDSLLYLNTDFFEFYHNNNFISLKQLLALEDSLKKAASQASLSNMIRMVNDSLMQEIETSMLPYFEQALDSALAQNALEQLAVLNQSYHQLYLINKTLVNQLKTARLNTINRAKDINDAVTPLNYNEVLEKTVNDIYLRNFAQGLDSLNATDVRVLKNIIRICPQAGGNAVYKARAMYEMINDSVEYNDSLVCQEVGYYRIAMQEIIEQTKIPNLPIKNENFEFTIFPNPIKSELNLKFSKNSSGTIKINDALGKLVYAGTLNNATCNYTIDLKHLSKGIYYISFSNKEVLVNKKFIKQ